VSEDTEDQKYMPWHEGVPTKPEVDALLKAFPPESIKPGEWRVTDDEVRSHIGRCDQRRFYVVTKAWRNRMERDHAVYVKDGEGFYCPANDEVLSDSHPALHRARRVVRKQRKRVSNVRPDGDQQRAQQEHVGRLLYASERSLKKDCMNVLPSTAAPKQPQIAPPAKALQK
jgi:hypothetical protein